MAATITALVPLIEALEPPVQAGLIALVNKLHKKQLSAQDYLDMAQVLISKETATPPSPAT